MDDLPANPESVASQASLAHDRQAASESLASHLFSLELALLDPAVRRDRARVGSLLAEDFQEYGASGKIWSRGQILDLLATEPARSIAAHDFVCNAIAEGVALVTYRALSTDSVTHKPSTTLRSSLWVCVEGLWKMRFHQGTREQGTREAQTRASGI